MKVYIVTNETDNTPAFAGVFQEYNKAYNEMCALITHVGNTLFPKSHKSQYVRKDGKETSITGLEDGSHYIVLVITEVTLK